MFQVFARVAFIGGRATYNTAGGRGGQASALAALGGATNIVWRMAYRGGASVGGRMLRNGRALAW